MNNEEIRISDLLLTIAKRWKLIVVMALVGCGLGLILNRSEEHTSELQSL